MPDILGVTNPVPGRENTNINRNVPLTQTNTQNNPNIQNVPDLGRVVHADGRTDRQDNNLNAQQRVRYDSNFETFVQRLRESPNLAESLSRLFGGREGTVVLSGMSEGVAQEGADLGQGLLEFLPVVAQDHNVVHVSDVVVQLQLVLRVLIQLVEADVGEHLARQVSDRHAPIIETLTRLHLVRAEAGRQAEGSVLAVDDRVHDPEQAVIVDL